MGDRVSASIVIGGTILPDHLEDFLEAVSDERVGPDWDDTFESRQALLAYLVAGEEGAAFYATEVNSGEFYILQRFCSDYGLAYKLTYDAYSGVWGAATRIRGLDGSEATCSLDADSGHACVTRDDVIVMGLADLSEVMAYMARFDLYQSPPLVIGPSAAPPAD
jgi:hypothetical protein